VDAVLCTVQASFAIPHPSVAFHQLFVISAFPPDPSAW
jgi:hypothetical protein